MKHYSDLFTTIYDEPAPVPGTDLGRGTHYSVLRAAPCAGAAVPYAVHDVCVIWDEDHDERIVWFVEQLCVRRLLGSVLFVGERKGDVTVLMDREPRQNEIDEIYALAQRGLPSDCWGAQTLNVRTDLGSLVDDDASRVRAYLGGIKALWLLGAKPAVFNTKPFEVE